MGYDIDDERYEREDRPSFSTETHLWRDFSLSCKLISVKYGDEEFTPERIDNESS